MTQNITGLSIKVNGEVITEREINRKYEKYLTSYRHSGSGIDEDLPDGHSRSDMDEDLPDGQNESRMDGDLPDGQNESRMDEDLPDGQSESRMDGDLPDGQSESRMDEDLPDGQSESRMDEDLPDDSKIEWAHRMIDHLLLIQYGRKHQLCPSVEELDKKMMEWIKRLEEDSPLSTGEDIRQDVMTTMIIENVKEKVVSEELSCNESQLKAFYDMNKQHFSRGEAVEVRHLLIRDGDSEDGKKPFLKAKVLLNRLKGGEDFARLASEFSECPSKERGGDLGHITHGSTDADFEEEVFKLKVMEISGIIESPLGLHIAQVLSRVENYILPYEVIEDKLKSFLNRVVSDEAINKLLTDLRNEAKIEYLGES